MNTKIFRSHGSEQLTLAVLPQPAKVLTTCIIVMLGIGMLGAAGQIIVHDIIPTFFARPDAPAAPGPAGSGHADLSSMADRALEGDRGDLFADLESVEKKDPIPFYQHDQFVWTLKWTHIHLFGMGMIFFFMGAVTIGLDASRALRTWLVVLPFVGVILDILAMWLKAFVSPVFFWLHVPGGCLFALIFGYVSIRALREMWVEPKTMAHPHRS